MAMPTQATELFLLEDLEDTGKMRGYKRLVLETPPADSDDAVYNVIAEELRRLPRRERTAG